jgi:hypothetical protein
MYRILTTCKEISPIGISVCYADKQSLLFILAKQPVENVHLQTSIAVCDVQITKLHEEIPQNPLTNLQHDQGFQAQGILPTSALIPPNKTNKEQWN